MKIQRAIEFKECGTKFLFLILNTMIDMDVYKLHNTNPFFMLKELRP